MIQNDVDLLEDQNNKDPYYFALKLINLKKNKRKSVTSIKNSHFKFIIEQDDYIIDQLRQNILNTFTTLKTTTLSLNNSILQFFLPDVNQSNAEFQLKMYLISHQEVQQLGQTILNVLTYIQIYLEDNKTIFRQTTSLCTDFSLEYEIYISKNKFQIENLIRSNESTNSALKNAFKKKTNEIIQIDHEKVQIKYKNTANQNNLLRKSLYINTKKLIQVKRRIKQSKQRSQSQDTSKSSIFSRLGNIFMKRAQQNYGPNYNKRKYSTPNQQFTSSQRSFAVSPPLIGPHKFNRPQNKSYYHNLNLNRQKQKERVQKSLNVAPSNKIYQSKVISSLSFFKILKIAISIFLISVIIYFLVKPTKRGKLKYFDSTQLLKF